MRNGNAMLVVFVNACGIVDEIEGRSHYQFRDRNAGELETNQKVNEQRIGLQCESGVQ